MDPVQNRNYGAFPNRPLCAMGKGKAVSQPIHRCPSDLNETSGASTETSPEPLFGCLLVVGDTRIIPRD